MEEGVEGLGGWQKGGSEPPSVQREWGVSKGQVGGGKGRVKG